MKIAAACLSIDGYLFIHQDICHKLDQKANEKIVLEVTPTVPFRLAALYH